MIDLWISKNPCISGINPACSCCMILLMYCWIQSASILLRIFVFMVIYNIGLFFSSSDIFVSFWYQGDGGLIRMSLGVFLPLQFFEEFEKGRCLVFSMFDRIHL